MSPTEKTLPAKFDQDGSDEYGEGGMGLCYFGKRFLDPETGRWVSTDPAEQFWDRYSYTGGNPILLIKCGGGKGPGTDR